MTHLFVLGDWGRRGAPGQRRVAAAMVRVARELPPAAIVSTGDNFYEFGVESPDDPHWRESYETVYDHPALAVPWYAVLGNHDHHGDVQAQVAYGQSNPRWRMPGRWYAERLELAGGVRIRLLGLDTSALLDRHHIDGLMPFRAVVGARPRAQLEWLDRTLAEDPADWTVVLGHHPVFSGSPYHGSTPELLEGLRPLLRKHRVDLYLCGHEHDLQHLEDGGVQHVLSGAGAEMRETGRLPQTRFAASTLGFAVVSFAARELWLRFFDASGALLHAAPVCARAGSRAACMTGS